MYAAMLSGMKARRNVLDSVGPQEIASVVTGVLALGTLAIRVSGRVKLAREQRQAITAVAEAIAATGRPARIRHRSAGTQWSLEVGNSPVTEEALRPPGPAAGGDLDR
ncbi:hypothetical protein [Streptomyces sp. NPDC052107]|uniref:hypothetical protein n=1 Tax=Streptomyces sp. NPDC052107 TaxID=3155632 RepID=UPI00341E9A66